MGNGDAVVGAMALSSFGVSLAIITGWAFIVAFRVIAVMAKHWTGFLSYSRLNKSSLCRYSLIKFCE